MRSRTRDDSLRHISSSSKGYRMAILNVQGLVLLGVLAEPEGSSRSLPFKRARLLCFEILQDRSTCPARHSAAAEGLSLECPASGVDLLGLIWSRMKVSGRLDRNQGGHGHAQDTVRGGPGNSDSVLSGSLA